MPNTLLIISIAAVILILTIAIFKSPLKMLLRLALNTAMGFLFLFCLNFLGAYINISIGINLINALIAGVLGLPGLGLLLAVKWLISLH